MGAGLMIMETGQFGCDGIWSKMETKDIVLGKAKYEDWKSLYLIIGFQDKGMLLAGGCGDTNGKPQIDKTDYLRQAYEFGRKIY